MKLKDKQEINLNISDLTDVAFEKDTRALAAFAAVKTPENNAPFSFEILMALKKLDWKKLLQISFKSKLDIQQSNEFICTVRNLCDYNQKGDIFRFLNQKFPNARNLLHPDYLEDFSLLMSEFGNPIKINFMPLNKNR